MGLALLCYGAYSLQVSAQTLSPKRRTCTVCCGNHSLQICRVESPVLKRVLGEQETDAFNALLRSEGASATDANSFLNGDDVRWQRERRCDCAALEC